MCVSVVDVYTYCYIMAPLKRIKDNADFIKATTVAHPEQCKALLRTAKHPQLDAICEILLNIVNGVVPLKQAVYEKAERYKKVLRQLVAKCSNKTVRRELMLKYFRILQKLLAAALPVIGLILSGLQVAGTLD